MNNKIIAVMRGARRPAVLCLFAVSFAFGHTAFAASAAQPKATVGVVAQRFPWNGTVDVTVKVSGVTAPEGATLVVTATPKGGAPVEVVRQGDVKDGEQTVSFDANKVDALKGHQLKNVKITVKIVSEDK